MLTVVIFTFTIEALLAVVMLPVFVAELGAGEGTFHAVFYAVSSFANAGFTLGATGLDHPVVLTTINVGVFAGALGFPVVYMLYRMVFYRAPMNLHTRLTLEVTTVLLVGGAILIAAFEWVNPATLVGLGTWDKLHQALFASGMTRSGGFSTYDVMDQTDQTLVVTCVLMFIGGGAGSTAGGIKVTTLAVLLLAIVAETRGDEHIRVHRREIPTTLVRVAVAVVTAGALLVLTAVVALTAVTGQGLATTTFEALSAFWHGRADHRFDGERPGSRTMDPGRADVCRPCRHHHAVSGFGGPAQTHVLSLPNRKAHHWLSNRTPRCWL